MGGLPQRLRWKLAVRRSPSFAKTLGTHRSSGGQEYELKSAEALDSVFVHVPKAAGLSVTHALFGSRGGGHIPLYHYLWLYGARRFDRMFKFAFVRHPGDRIASAFTFLKAGGISPEDRVWRDSNLAGVPDLDAFVQEKLVRPEIRRMLHFREQAFYLTDPRTGRIGVDFVGRFERIQLDFARISRTLGIDAQLGHHNRAARDGRSMSAESRKIVEALYRQDYELLGY